MGFGKGKGASHSPIRDAHGDGTQARSADIAPQITVDVEDMRTIRFLRAARHALADSGGHNIGPAATAWLHATWAIDRYLRVAGDDAASEHATIFCSHCGLPYECAWGPARVAPHGSAAARAAVQQALAAGPPAALGDAGDDAAEGAEGPA